MKGYVMGAPFGNTNAVTHGKYVRASLLQCNRCMVKDICPEFIEGESCFFEKPLLQPLSAVSNGTVRIREFAGLLRVLANQDWLRLQRQFVFERMHGGILDVDTVKLEQHVVKLVEIAARVEEKLEVETMRQRVEALEKELGYKPETSEKDWMVEWEKTREMEGSEEDEYEDSEKED